SRTGLHYFPFDRTPVVEGFHRKQLHDVVEVFLALLEEFHHEMDTRGAMEDRVLPNVVRLNADNFVIKIKRREADCNIAGISCELGLKQVTQSGQVVILWCPLVRPEIVFKGVFSPRWLYF